MRHGTSEAVLSCLGSSVDYSRTVSRRTEYLCIWQFGLAKDGGGTGPEEGFFWKDVCSQREDMIIKHGLGSSHRDPAVHLYQAHLHFPHCPSSLTMCQQSRGGGGSCPP